MKSPVERMSKLDPDDLPTLTECGNCGHSFGLVWDDLGTTKAGDSYGLALQKCPKCSSMVANAFGPKFILDEFRSICHQSMKKS